MRFLVLLTLVALGISGCNKPMTPESIPKSPDNTAVNVRDRDIESKTPIDQNETQRDIDITAKIRKEVVDTQMSVNAQNIKIITQDGKVTLRGPVKSAEEKQRIEEIANAIAGGDKVDNQLDIE